MFHSTSFVQSSPVGEHLSCFCTSAIVNNATVNKGLWTLIPFPLDKYPEVEIWDDMLFLLLVFLFVENPPSPPHNVLYNGCMNLCSLPMVCRIFLFPTNICYLFLKKC